MILNVSRGNERFSYIIFALRFQAHTFALFHNAWIMMNKEELQAYRDRLFKEYQQEELGFQRVKLELSNKKKMLDLLDEQINGLPSSVDIALEVAKNLKWNEAHF